MSAALGLNKTSHWADNEEGDEGELKSGLGLVRELMVVPELPATTETTGADGITTIISYKLDGEGRKVKVHQTSWTTWKEEADVR
jgi:hypothetical protein